MRSFLKAHLCVNLLLVALAAAPARGIDLSWDGSRASENWDSVGGPLQFDTNWNVPVMIPGSLDTVTFPDTAFDFIVDLNGSRTVLSATFAGGSDYSLFSGGLSTDTLTLVTGDITTTGSATHWIDSDVVLGNTGNWSIGNPLFRVTSNISGAFGLNKSGTGTLELAAANTYSGRTNIDAGTILLNHANALQNSTVAINVNGGLDITTNTIDANFGGLEGTGNLNLGSQLLTVGSNGSNTAYSGDLSGAGILTKTGAGRLTLTLASANTYFGGTRINQGTLKVFSDANLGAPGGALTFNGGTLHWGVRFDLDPARAVTVNAGGGTIRTDFFDTAISQAITGEGGLTKQGTGTLELTGANTYFGGTFFDEGFLKVSSDANLSVSVGALTFDGGALIWGASFDLNSARDITLNAGGGSFHTDTFDTTISQAITGAGGLTKYGTGTLTLTSANTYSGDTTINNGTLQIGNGDTTGSITGDVEVNSGNVLAFNRSNDLTYAGEISGAGRLTKQGAGSLTLTNFNTYSGGTFLDDGILKVSSDANLGVSAGALTFDGGDLRWSASFDLDPARAITLNAGGGTFRTGNNITTISQAITGEGGLTKRSTGTLTLTGTNTYSGGTTINGGILAASSDVNLGATTGPLTFDGGDLLFMASFDLDAGRAIALGAGGGNIRTNIFTTTVSQAITGIGGLTKTGAGTLTLTGANTYTGGTTINGGTLLANNTTGSATGSGAVAVNSGGTLGGTGSVAGAVTVSGGSLAPGASVGQLTVDSIILNGSSQLFVELVGGGGVAGTDFDQLVVTGNATLDGLLDVSLIVPFTPSFGQSFEIIDVAGSLTGTFSGLSQGALVGNFGGTDLFIDYTSGDGNDISLVATQTGDFDFDFNVDGFDFLKWQRGFGDIYGSADLADWEDNFGTAAPLSAVAAATTVVPEPSTGIMLLLGMVTVLADRRKARSKPNTV